MPKPSSFASPVGAAALSSGSFPSSLRALFVTSLTIVGCSPATPKPHEEPPSLSSATLPKIPPAEGPQSVSKVAPPSKSDTPFSSTLRADLRDMHEASRKTPFIVNAMAGKVSVEQYTLHLKQMFLVHQAIDSALRPGGNCHPLATIASLYGEQQQSVVSALKKDLLACGVTTVTERDALPETKAFIDSIRAAAVSDPLLVAGMNHVYFGAVCFGGATIAKKIETGFGNAKPPEDCFRYYGQTSGFAAYRDALNKVSSAADQGRIIAGGRLAYKFTDELNNHPLFK